MSFSIQVLSTLTVCLSLTPLAVAQTTTPQEQPPAPSPAAKPATGNLPPTASPPQPRAASEAPAQPTPAAPARPAPSAAPPTANPPMPPAPAHLKVRACENNWTRGGFYMRITNGLGDMKMSGTGPKGAASISGLGANSLLAIGGSLGHGLVLAGTLQTMSVTATFNGGPFVDEKVTSNGVSLTASSKADAAAMGLGVLVDWYPDPSGGWHVGLSAGVGALSVKNHADGSTLSGTSSSGSLFGGYDWAIGPGWSFGLGLVANGTRSASLKDSADPPQSNYRMKAYTIGFSGSFLYF